MKHKNKMILAIFPIILVVFLLFTISGMKSYEQRIVVLYHEHTLLLGQLSQTNNSNVQETLIAQFGKKVDLTPQEERKNKLSSLSQTALDALTLCKRHCIMTDPEAGCKVYTSSVIDAAQARQKRIAVIQKRFPDDPIANAQVYTSLELIFKAFVLAVEGLVAGLLIQYIIKRARKK